MTVGLVDQIYNVVPVIDAKWKSVLVVDMLRTAVDVSGAAVSDAAWSSLPWSSSPPLVASALRS